MNEMNLYFTYPSFCNNTCHHNITGVEIKTLTIITIVEYFTFKIL